MAIGDVYQTNIRYTISGQRAITVLHWQVTEDVGAADADKEQKLADYLASTANPGDFMSQLVTVLPSDCVVDQVDAQAISPLRLAYRTAPVGLAGDLEAGNNPAVDVVITKRTDLAGRDQVGSIHQPGIPSTMIVGGLIDNAYRVDVLEVWDTLLMPIMVDGTEWSLALLHTPPAVPATSLITNMAVKPEARVMQRRVVGRGI